MGQILLFIIALVSIMVIFALVMSRREAGRNDTSTKKEFIGICKSAVETASQKDARKQKIIRCLPSKASFLTPKSAKHSEFPVVPPCAIWTS